MRINDLYRDKYGTSPEALLLKKNCSQFISESCEAPLLKNLSIDYNDFDKVKVRKRKGESGDFTETFNEAFETQHPGIRQRAVFANGKSSFQRSSSLDLEPFYIFPTNNYKFMYSREVTNSGHEYKQVFETLFDQFGEEKSNDVLTDLLRFTYTSLDLNEGIESGSEIIIYGIPYFYAIRAAGTEYGEVLSEIAR